MAGRSDGRGSRRYWVWVTGPEYYLDDDGAERRGLDPGQGYQPGGWWTCHRDTEQGDLVLLYRSRLKKDLAYLIETRSAAVLYPGRCAREKAGWDYGCDYEVLEKFAKPLTLGEMKSDPVLKDWGVLRSNFRRRVCEITPDIWDCLLDRLAVDTRKVRQKAAKRHTLEREIEDRLAKDLRPFRPHGYKLEYPERQHIFGAVGEQTLWLLTSTPSSTWSSS